MLTAMLATPLHGFFIFDSIPVQLILFRLPLIRCPWAQGVHPVIRIFDRKIISGSVKRLIMLELQIMATAF